MRLAYAGQGVWVGDYETCNKKLSLFDLHIHVWREKNRGENRMCQHALQQNQSGITICWREGEPLAAMSVPIEKVIEYATQPGQLFIHCAGGVCRSATLAIIAKIMRGCDRWLAFSDVYKAIWPAYGYTFAPHSDTIHDVLRWLDGRII